MDLLTGAILDNIRPLPEPMKVLIEDGTVPDRLYTDAVECESGQNDDDGNWVECTWAGQTDIAVFGDEEIWFCPFEHENSRSR